MHVRVCKCVCVGWRRGGKETTKAQTFIDSALLLCYRACLFCACKRFGCNYNKSEVERLFTFGPKPASPPVNGARRHVTPPTEPTSCSCVCVCFSAVWCRRLSISAPQITFDRRCMFALLKHCGSSSIAYSRCPHVADRSIDLQQARARD